MAEKKEVSEILKDKLVDQRTLQCGTEGQYSVYIPKEFVEKLGLTKGSALSLVVMENSIIIYPHSVFMKIFQEGMVAIGTGTGMGTSGNESP